MGQITIDEMHNSLFDYAQAVSDENLITESKTVVGAINEIYGKKLIANAIGEPLNSTDTYAKMNNDINNLLSTFKTNMMNSGVTVESSDKFKSLIDKIKGLTEGEGNKGIQFAEGTCAVTNSLITHNCGFIPTYFFVLAGRISMQYKTSNGFYNSVLYNPVISNIRMFGSDTSIGISGSSSITELNESTAKISNISGDVTWYAIGVGEEDTTIESSIISILKTKGYDESKDNIIDFIENKLYTKVIEPGTNVTIATGEGLESRRSENNQLFTKSLIVPSLSNLGSDNIKGLSLKVVSWAYHDDYGPQQYSMSDGYFRIQIKRDGVVINNAFESSAYTYNYNNGNGTTHAYDLLDVQEGDVIEYTVGYYASGFLGTNVHEYHFGVKGAYLTYSIGYVTSL